MTNMRTNGDTIDLDYPQSSSPLKNGSNHASNLTPISALTVGCKVKVHRPHSSEWRLAEILSIRVLEPPPTLLINSSAPSGPQREFYVHYADFNKRLDEWVSPARLDLSYVEQPRNPITPGIGRRPGKGPPKSTTFTPRSIAQKGPRKAPQKGPWKGPLKTPQKRPQKGPLKFPRLLPEKSTPSTPTPGIITPQKRPRLVTEETDEDFEDSESIAGTLSVKSDDEDDDSRSMTSLTADTASQNGSVSVPGTQSQDQGDVSEGGPFSKDEEIDRLRVSGSMTQSVSEVSRLKNLMLLQMGCHIVEPWYFSPYPEEFSRYPIVYLCEFCLSYFGSQRCFQRHRSKCTLRHPPGNEIYRDGVVSFWEIDGRKQKRWSRNLCLLSKCFLDHKTLYFDVDPFLFYILTISDEHGCHVVGYFSKEKESSEGYNVACILTLPQYQRKGWGKVLIQFSYLLSKVEGRLGSPEKPLSDLGLLSYRAFWTEVLMDQLIPMVGDEISIEELAIRTSMTPADVQHTLQALGVLKYHRAQHIIALTRKSIQQHEKVKNRSGRRLVKAECLQWKPPTFGFQDRFVN